MSFPVFFDTCVLFGGALNNVLLTLAESDVFRPLWSDQILDELRTNLSKRIDPQNVEKRIKAMTESFPDSTVEGYDYLINSMTCDDGDKHVLAAVVRSEAHTLVTFNLSDFPADSVTEYDIDVIHPDDFLLDQLDLYPFKVTEALAQITMDYENPPITIDTFLDILSRAGAPKFTKAVARLL
jgi:predicted nucleic acid-binding protein